MNLAFIFIVLTVFTILTVLPMSILDHLSAAFRPNEGEQNPLYKSSCCMKYTVDVQCKRCPFKQITDEKARDEALHKCYDKRRGTYKWNDVEIEYNNQYQ